MAPALATADALYERRLTEAAKGDAKDSLWAIEAIRDYNPGPDLDKMRKFERLVRQFFGLAKIALQDPQLTRRDKLMVPLGAVSR